MPIAGKTQKALQPELKDQLQKKSSARRKRFAAETDVERAASLHRRNDLQPDLQLIQLPVGALRPSARRARVTKPEQLERVITSIREFGLVGPVLIDCENRIVSGHVRWEAAQRLGFETIRCLVIDHLDEAEVGALSLALNRMAETGTWDIDLLRTQLIEIGSAGINLESTGFTLAEIDQITILDEPVEDTVQEDEPDDGQTSPVSIQGDLFALGEHRLLCGDALEAASYDRLLEGNLAQSVFSDPPYNCPIEGFVSGLGKTKHSDFAMAVGELDEAGFRSFLKTYLGHCQAFTSGGAMIFACMDWRQIDQLLLAAGDLGLKRNNIAVWNKGAGGMGSLYRSAHEFVAVLCNGQSPATNNVELGKHGRDRTNVWSYPGANRRGSTSSKALADHPTPKPVELVADALLDVTNRGDIVLDPFLGSGTTMIAAQTVGRVCHGIELDPKYVDRAIRRWEELTGERAIHLATGLTFEELRVARSSDEEAGND